MKTYIFHIHLFNNPKIIREIEVLEDISLYKLAETIVGAYDFDFDHLKKIGKPPEQYPDYDNE